MLRMYGIWVVFSNSIVLNGKGHSADIGFLQICQYSDIGHCRYADIVDIFYISPADTSLLNCSLALKYKCRWKPMKKKNFFAM